MYKLSESEYMQFEAASYRLENIRKQHAEELQEAYDGIHPTRTNFDFQQGSIYWESVNPADYAVYLVDMQEEHARIEKWWSLRADAYNKALLHLAEDERNSLFTTGYQSFKEKEKVRKKLKEILSTVISSNNELQRKTLSLDVIEDMEEADRRIDAMTDEELFEDYWDLDERINQEKLKEQCCRLYDTHDVTYSDIGKILGIETSRVKQYVGRHEKEVS